MKSVKMFGKSVPILTIVVIVLFAGVGVYAGLVNYLSNPVATITTVESPVTLRLFRSDGIEMPETTTLTLQGGESFDFFKVAHNDGEVGVRFAIALVIKGVQVGEAVIVDSAGPTGPTSKLTIGTTAYEGTPEALAGIWNDAVWHNNEGAQWYFHGAHDSDKIAEYDSYLKRAWDFTFSTNLNTEYVDAVVVGSGADECYVVMFGGTIGDALNGGTYNANSLVTNWGYGGSNTYYPTDGSPNVMPPDDGETAPRGYDVGKVRIIFREDYVETVDFGMQVVFPGSTVQQVIDSIFPP